MSGFPSVDCDVPIDPASLHASRVRIPLEQVAHTLCCVFGGLSVFSA